MKLHYEEMATFQLRETKRAAVELHKPEMESFNEVKGRLTKRTCGEMQPEHCVSFLNQRFMLRNEDATGL